MKTVIADSNETVTEEDSCSVIVNKPPVFEEEKPETPTPEIIIKPSEKTGVIEIIEQPEHGSAVVDDDGNIVFTPDGSFEGTDKIKIKIIDENGEEYLYEFEITDEEVAAGYADFESPQTSDSGMGKNIIVLILAALLLYIRKRI